MEESGGSVADACQVLSLSRAGYYRWRSGIVSPRVAENQRIAERVKEIHAESPDKGYRRIRDDLERYYDTPVNDKRVRRICQSLEIKSTMRPHKNPCKRQTLTE